MDCIRKLLLIITLLLSIAGYSKSAKAQYVDGYDYPDSTYFDMHKPHKATFFSSLVPGLGQFYNEKYWKIPIIYGGFTGLIYFANYNNFVYKKYRQEYKWATDDDPNTVSTYPASNTLRLKDSWRRYRDMCIIGIGALYLLQIIDANVDAHFFDFTIDKDLSIRGEPMILPDYSDITGDRTETPLGMRLTVTF